MVQNMNRKMHIAKKLIPALHIGIQPLMLVLAIMIHEPHMPLTEQLTGYIVCAAYHLQWLWCWVRNRVLIDNSRNLLTLMPCSCAVPPMTCRARRHGTSFLSSTCKPRNQTQADSEAMPHADVNI